MTKKAPSTEKRPTSKLRGWGFAFIIIGFIITIASGFVYGFELVSRDVGIAFIALGLGAVATGLGFVSVGLGRESSETNRAMANLVFHEKIAIMSSYLGKREQQISHDRTAALQFEKWVEPRLKKEFEDLWHEFSKYETRPIVVKIGGSTLSSQDTTLQDLVALQQRGIIPVVVHGGGNMITQWLERMGISTSFVRGMRVTDEETLRVVIAVLAGLVNKELVAKINSLGGKAMGLSGIDASLIEARIQNPDAGYVGEVVKVNPESIAVVLGAGYIPVIAPGGFQPPSEDSEPVTLLNINGDVSASEIALALHAERLIFLTDVPGVRDGNGNLLATLTADEARSLIDSGVITGGMIPKVEGCLRALHEVSTAQIVDGSAGGALLAAINGEDIGTTIEL